MIIPAKGSQNPEFIRDVWHRTLDCVVIGKHEWHDVKESKDILVKVLENFAHEKYTYKHNRYFNHSIAGYLLNIVEERMHKRMTYEDLNYVKDSIWQVLDEYVHNG